RLAGAAGRARTEPAPAESPADGGPSAVPVPRLRRDVGPVLLRDRRTALRAARRCVGPREPEVDGVRVGNAVAGAHGGDVVGLRGARLGRLLGMGPGRERVVHAVADRDRLPALRDGPGTP